MTRTVVYHSPDWSCLVEQGWITMVVNNIGGEAIATMLYQERMRVPYPAYYPLRGIDLKERS